MTSVLKRGVASNLLAISQRFFKVKICHLARNAKTKRPHLSAVLKLKKKKRVPEEWTMMNPLVFLMFQMLLRAGGGE